MGGFSSKQVDEAVKQTQVDTPKRPKVLPFDPRSPSEDISRTPITVSFKFNLIQFIR